MNKEYFLIEYIDKKIQSTFNKIWKQIMNEKEGDYEIVYNDVYEEALITYTIDYINRYTDVKKIQKDKCLKQENDILKKRYMYE
jgi:hypothetical protein